jgi:hypothetical protein
MSNVATFAPDVYCQPVHEIAGGIGCEPEGDAGESDALCLETLVEEEMREAATIREIFSKSKNTGSSSCGVIGLSKSNRLAPTPFGAELSIQLSRVFRTGRREPPVVDRRSRRRLSPGRLRPPET